MIFTSTPEQMAGYWLNLYFPVAMARSMDQMPSLRVVDAALRRTGYRHVETEPFHAPPDLADLFLYAGHDRPRLYLDENVRRGISTFASLADPAELEAGLEGLRADLEDGTFEEIRARYDSRGGDYLFVVAR